MSTIVNRGSLKAYVFRNYNLLPGMRSPYLGGSQHQLWQAIRATSAAPGYFQEFKLGNDLHQVCPTHSSNGVVGRKEGGVEGVTEPVKLSIELSGCHEHNCYTSLYSMRTCGRVNV